MSTNLTTAEQLSSLVSAIKAYTDAKQQETIALTIDAIELAGSSSVAVEKTTPALTLSAWAKNGTTYTTTISYNGDGTLSTNIGSISGNTLSVTDSDGTFAGVVTATAGASFAATSLNFSYNTTQAATVITKETPDFSDEDIYEFDGQLGTLHYNENGNISIAISNSEYPGTDPEALGNVYYDESAGDWKFILMHVNGQDPIPDGVTVTFYLAETATYKAASFSVTTPIDIT